MKRVWAVLPIIIATAVAIIPLVVTSVYVTWRALRDGRVTHQEQVRVERAIAGTLWVLLARFTNIEIEGH